MYLTACNIVDIIKAIFVSAELFFIYPYYCHNIASVTENILLPTRKLTLLIEKEYNVSSTSPLLIAINAGPTSGPPPSTGFHCLQ